MVSISGMVVSLKMDLRFPIAGQQGYGIRNIQLCREVIKHLEMKRKFYVNFLSVLIVLGSKKCYTTNII